MSAGSPLRAAQLRLATHYLGKLREANDLLHGQPPTPDAVLADRQRDWEQVRQFQAWAAAGAPDDDERARLCVAFARGTEHVLQVWQAPSQQYQWVRHALAAVRRLGDAEAEPALLHQAAVLALTLEALEVADAFGNQYLAWAEASSDGASLGRAWYVLAMAAFTRGNYEAAERLYTRCLSVFDPHGSPDELMRVWRGLARVYQFQGNYGRARDYYRRYLEAGASRGNVRDVLDARIALSGIMLALRDYAGAEQEAEVALDMARAFPASTQLPRSLLALAHAQKWLGKLESASRHYEDAIAAARISCPPSTIINALYGLGQARFLAGDVDAALEHLREALPIARSVPHPLRIFEVCNDLVFVHVVRGEPDRAFERLRQSVDIAQGLGTPHFLAKALAAATVVLAHCERYEPAAIWAGLVQEHERLLHPSLFNASLYPRLEAALGAERYRQLTSEGRRLTLENTLEEILTMLDAEAALVSEVGPP